MNLSGPCRALAAALLLIAAAVPDWAQGTTFDRRFAAIEAFGSLAENSPGERAAFRYIETVLRGAGISTTDAGFDDARDGHSFSSILEASIPGSRPDQLAVIVPLSSWIDAPDHANGAAALALALSEAERLASLGKSGRVFPVSLRFVFLGAERRGRMAEGEEASFGSQTWIAQTAGSAPLAVVYLSIDSLPATVDLRNAGKGLIAPFWHYDRVRRALEAAGMPVSLDANRFQIYRLGLADRYGPVAPYLAAGIPAVEIKSEAAQTGAPAITGAEAIAWFTRFMDDLLQENGDGFKDSWDRHYLIFQLGKLSAVAGEKTYIGFLLAFSGAAASAFLALTVLRRDAAKTLLRKAPAMAWQVLALFIALAAVFSAGRGLARLDALMLGSADAWRLAPRLFAGGRILSTFLLFLALLSILVERRVLTPNPYFYEFAALACLCLDVFVFSAVQPPVSFYFVWAFLVVGISLAIRRPWATLAAYLVMYAPLLLLAAELAMRPEYAVYHSVIAPGLGSILALSALTLPFFIFTASPLLFYAPPGATARKRTARIFIACALAVEGGVLTYAAAGSVGGTQPGEKPPELVVSEVVDQNAGVFSAEMRAERRIGSGRLYRDDRLIPYASSGDRARFGGPDPARRIRLAESRSFFLDRATDSIRIDFARRPYRVALSLAGQSELQIYDCNFPYETALDGRSARIFVGVNPGSSLEIELTVPRAFRAALTTRAEYLNPLVPYRFEDGSVPDFGSFAVTETSPISGGGGP